MLFNKRKEYGISCINDKEWLPQGKEAESRLAKNYKIITSLTLKTGSAAVVIVAASVGGISAVSNAGDTVGYKYKYSRIKITRQKLGILHILYKKSKRKHILQRCEWQTRVG